jgi:ATP-binding cassette, subfamily B, bacterial
MSFTHYNQIDAMDCGPTCLRMIAKHYGRNYSLAKLRELCHISKQGVSLLGISEAAEQIGFRTLSIKTNYSQMLEDALLPFIAHWNQNHFVVVYKMTTTHVWIADPASDQHKLKKEDFLKSWASDIVNGADHGIILLLETTPGFKELEEEKIDRKGFAYLFKYIWQYKSLLVQIFLGFLLGSIFQLIFPFLTQSIVDVGIQNQDVNFIYLILAGQLMLFFSQTVVNFIRSWILLHIGARVNISLISDFLSKLMKLPIAFFDTKMTGDIMQRISDNSRIQTFLTSSSLDMLFSLFNLVLFSAVLLFYNVWIFVVFASGAILYILWIILFLKRRKEIDYLQFNQRSDNQSKIVQLISGMQEIKLNNAEKQKRWEWERIQAKLYKISLKSLALEQWQQGGATFITQLSNIIMTFLTAKLVIDGNITLGMMLAVQYIIGQLNAPLSQMISFFQTAQDAKISLERLSEIHDKEDEIEADKLSMTDLPDNRDILFHNVSFSYEGTERSYVLKNINLKIPQGKTTAIVGMSGSGKTTLLKLLMKFYEPNEGEIKIGSAPLQNISNRMWRDRLGTVMQEGYIFSDTIANNIAVGDESVDKKRLSEAVKIANIEPFIEALPLAYNTKIGQEGMGISQGQKQRILIARAVYKNPDLMLFDEATNSLDASNEKVIMEQLHKFYDEKTVIIVAHRLSTVKDAHQIIVLDQGEIIEQGNHQDLTKLKGVYYSLVKNQLEMGS